MNAPSLGLILFTAAAVCGCGGAPSETIDSAVDQFRESGRKLREATAEMAEQAQAGESTLTGALADFQESLERSRERDPLDFRDLYAFLPPAPPDFTAGPAQGQQQSLLGRDSSMAQQTFTHPNGEVATVSLTDTGGLQSLAALSQQAMHHSGYRRETDQAYERPMTYLDQAGFERYDESHRTGSKDLLVGDLFHIRIEGGPISESTLHDLLVAIDVPGLAALSTNDPVDEL